MFQIFSDKVGAIHLGSSFPILLLLLFRQSFLIPLIFNSHSSSSSILNHHRPLPPPVSGGWLLPFPPRGFLVSSPPLIRHHHFHFPIFPYFPLPPAAFRVPIPIPLSLGNANLLPDSSRKSTTNFFLPWKDAAGGNPICGLIIHINFDCPGRGTANRKQDKCVGTAHGTSYF
jgi:hypothetical protein